MKDHERIKPLLMGLMDNELSAEERQEVNNYLTRCSKCREEYESLRESSGKLNTISFIEPTDEVLKYLWKSPFSSLMRNSALFFIVGGYVALAGYGIYNFLISGELTFPKIAVVAIIFGFAFLLFSVIRERIKTYKVDPYKEVVR